MSSHTDEEIRAAGDQDPKRYYANWADSVSIVREDDDEATTVDMETLFVLATDYDTMKTRLKGERNELQGIFDLQWAADMRAIKQWQAETGKDRIWPDREKMVLWLLERDAQQAGEIAALRGLLRRERYEVLHDYGCDCDLCVAVDAALTEKAQP